MAKMPKAISDYLNLLDGSLRIENTALKEAQAQLNNAVSRVEKLEARIAETRARENDPASALEAKFVEAFPKWAHDNGLTAEEVMDLMQDLNIPEHVIQQMDRTPPAPKQKVTKASVEEHVKARTDDFTATAVKDATGAATGTVHNVLKELELQEVIAKVEGMKPTTYRNAA